MVTKKIFYSALTALLFATGCGSSGNDNSSKEESSPTSASSQEGTKKDLTIETAKGVYKYKVINNRKKEVSSTVDSYDVKLYSDIKIKAYDKSPHKGVIVRVNNKESELMAIQTTYLDESIVAKAYKDGKIISTSDAVEVTDDEPIVFIDMDI